MVMSMSPKPKVNRCPLCSKPSEAAHAPFLSHADEFAETYRNFVEKAV